MKKSLVLLLGLGFVYAANAEITVVAVGGGGAVDYDVIGAESQGFRSSAVAKTFDEDDDNVYGTDGVFFAGTATVATGANLPFTVNTPGGVANGGWVTVSAGSDLLSTPVRAQEAYVNIDDPLGTGVDVKIDDPLGAGTEVADWPNTAHFNSGIGAGYREALEVSIDSTAPGRFRLGIMSGHESTLDGRWDPQGIRVSVVGGSSSAEVTNLSALYSTTGMVFFDVFVTDSTEGTLVIETIRREIGGTSRGSTITGLTFDELPAPNTLTLLGMVLGAGLLIRIRKHI